MQPVINTGCLFFLQQCVRHAPQKTDDLLMGVDHSLALIFSLIHPLTDPAHHPDHTQQMVDMLVGDEHRMNVLPVNPGLSS